VPPRATAEDVFFLKNPILEQGGGEITPGGVMVGPELLKAIAGKGKKGMDLPLINSPIAGDFEPVFSEEDLKPFFDLTMRSRVLGVLEKLFLPEALLNELIYLRSELPFLYHHSLATTILFLRLLLEIVFKVEDLVRAGRAVLLKDIGMSRIPPDLHRNRDHLTLGEFVEIQRHTLIGLVIHTYYLGESLEGMVALRHHMRNGYGYPPWKGLKPSRLMDLVEVVDIFYALISPRPFRPIPYDVRGAVDELTEMAKRGEVGEESLKLLVACLRHDRPEAFQLTLSEKRLGFVPKENFYGVGRE
jgi:HD-GYP domain-containing protein (c-di-GMP phosphodiesterase class II)